MLVNAVADSVTPYRRCILWCSTPDKPVLFKLAPGTCTRPELVQVNLISHLVIPVLTAAVQTGTAQQLLDLQVLEAFMNAAFRPHETVLFGEEQWEVWG